MQEDLLKEILIEIREIKSDISTLKSDVSTLKSQVDENTRILRSLEHTMEVNTAERDAIKNDVNKLFGEVRTIKEVARMACKMLA